LLGVGSCWDEFARPLSNLDGEFGGSSIDCTRGGWDSEDWSIAFTSDYPSANITLSLFKSWSSAGGGNDFHRESHVTTKIIKRDVSLISECNGSRAILLQRGSGTVLKVMWALSNSGLVVAVGGIGNICPFCCVGSKGTCAVGFSCSSCFLGVYSTAANITGKITGGKCDGGSRSWCGVRCGYTSLNPGRCGQGKAETATGGIGSIGVIVVGSSGNYPEGCIS